MLRRQVELVRSWGVFVVLSAAVAATVTFVLLNQVQPSYASHVSALVTPPLTEGEITYNDILVGQALAQTYADVAATRPLLQRVIASTGVDVSAEELASNVTTEVADSSSLVEITVSHRDPVEAANLANAIATELAGFVPAASDPGATARVSLVVIEPAIPSSEPVSPRILSSTALGGAIGVIFAVSLAFIVENLRSGRRPGL